MIEKLRPLNDRVLIKRVEQEEITAGGIIIPDAAQEKTQIAQVIAVGPGKTTSEGKVIPLQVKEGDKVFFSKYAGVEAGDEYIIIREDEILGVV